MGRIVLACLVALLPVVLEQACSPTSSSPSANVDNSGASSTTGCSTPAGFSGTPKSIEETIAQINALPKPVTVACFLESLKRPLYANATNSTTSAQPAYDTRSPRIFILMDPLTISVVPQGVGSEVVELSVANGTVSLKGELAFPVTANIPLTTAYDRIRFGTGTVCQFCHLNETRAADFPSTFAFRSNAVRPKPTSKVDMSYLKNESLICNPAAEGKRCDILKGFFGHGPIVEKDFPSNLPTLF